MTHLYVQLLGKKYKGRVDDNADEIISIILESTERMQKLIQNALSYAQTGKGNISFKEVDCNVVINRAIKNLRASIGGSRARIICEDCPVIMGDEIQLTQVFQNLISNAVKFRKSAGIFSIRISIKQKNSQWVFAIQDNGIGIRHEDIQYIFELFKRLHAHHEYPGTGIGLTLCKRIIESHGGEIWVESEIGKGTTFFFTLPVLPATRMPSYE